MELFKRMIVYMFVGIMTEVVSLNVYLDTEKRILVPGNTDINCLLPNVTNGPMAISLEHIETSVNSTETVWIGWQSHFTKWLDFRGCIKRRIFSAKLENKSIDISDPVLDCYKFCDPLSFMLSNEKCFCIDILPPPDKDRPGFDIVNSSFVGNYKNVMCMYGPLTNYTHEFNERQDGNCIYAFKDYNDELKFSNDLCKESKTPVCVVLSRKEFIRYDKESSMWLNNPSKCTDTGTILPSYSIIKDNRANATKAYTGVRVQYWIAAFRRPLYTCMAADLYTNRTLGKPRSTSCNTKLRSLCIRSVAYGGSKADAVTAESTGNVGVGGSTGNVVTGESTWNAVTGKSMRNIVIGESTENVVTGVYTESVGIGESTGNVRIGESTENVVTGESTGNVLTGQSMVDSDQTTGYIYGIIGSVCVLCILIAFLLYLYMRKVQKSKNNNFKNKTRSSVNEKGSMQTQAGVQSQRQNQSPTFEDLPDNEYSAIGALSHLPGCDDEIYHKLHEKPRSQETDFSNYDHVTHAIKEDNSHYDVFSRKNQLFNSDNVISDYDTTFNIKHQIEGDYDTMGVQKIDRELSEYDSVTGPSGANNI